MIDRLPELRKMAGMNMKEIVTSDDGLRDDEAIQMKNQGLSEQFKSQIADIESKLIRLDSNSKKITIARQKYSKASKGLTQKQCSDQLNAILTENSTIQKSIKTTIASIQDAVTEAGQNEPDEPETRMKRFAMLKINKKIEDSLHKQHETELQFKNMVKDKVTRQVRLISPDVNDTQLQEYLEDPDAFQKMFQKKILGEASISLKNAVCDIQDKFRDILTLEKSTNQCVDLFNQFAALVQAQGQLIDNIGANTEQCKDYVQRAEKHLEKAKQHQKCSRKCICCALIIGVIVLVIIVIIVVASK